MNINQYVFSLIFYIVGVLLLDSRWSYGKTNFFLTVLILTTTLGLFACTLMFGLHVYAPTFNAVRDVVCLIALLLLHSAPLICLIWRWQRRVA